MHQSSYPTGNLKPLLPNSIYNHLPHPSSSGKIKRLGVGLTLSICLIYWYLLISSDKEESTLTNSGQDGIKNTSPYGLSASPSDPTGLSQNVGKNPRVEATSRWAAWSIWKIPSASIWLNNHFGNKNDHPSNLLTTAIDGGDPSSQWPSPTPGLPLTATLRERLDDWRNAPLPEPAHWVQFNLQTCPDSRIGKNANYDLLKRAHLLWATINMTHIRQKREELISFLEQADRNKLLSEQHWGTGKGIVFTAGNVDTFARVLLSVRMFREHLKCILPVEVFSFPGEAPDDETRNQLEALNVTLRIVGWAQKDTHRNKNFHIKASALVACSFREPLYLDSDNLPAILEPGTIESLWESKGYKKLGALFWPDYWKTHADVPIWILIGTQCRDEWEQEAGQILIDKSKHLDMLLLSEHMLKDWRYWFQLSDGDKDIFRYAMLALRKRWALPGRYLGAAGLSWDTLSGYCGHTMLQYDPVGKPLFVHMNLLKQIPSGITQGTTFKRTRQVNIPMNASETLTDEGIEADMLANADETGRAIMPASDLVRRRAALERGLQPFLHGGGRSAICADIKWTDPGLKRLTSLDVWEDPTEIVWWPDDPRLSAFEDRFYGMGGKTNADGF